MPRLPRRIGQWAKAIVAAAISGAASSFLASVGVGSANAVGLNVQQFTKQQLLATTCSGALVGMAAYLVKSPVPPGPSGDTDFVNKPADITPK